MTTNEKIASLAKFLEKPTRAEVLFVRIISKEATPKEVQEFQNWLDFPRENR